MKKVGGTAKPFSLALELAKKYGCTTDDFMQKLVESMYLKRVEGHYQLTEFGMNMGGEEKNHPRFGRFFAWPEDLPLSSIQ